MLFCLEYFLEIQGIMMASTQITTFMEKTYSVRIYITLNLQKWFYVFYHFNVCMYDFIFKLQIFTWKSDGKKKRLELKRMSNE